MTQAAKGFLRDSSGAFALQKPLRHASLAVIRMYAELVARDLADAQRRTSRGDDPGV